MDDIKQGARDLEDKSKETWRKADGDESVADKIGNAGDDIRRNLGNAGDDAREGMDDTTTDYDRDQTPR